MPILGEVNAKDVSLPLITLVLGLVDGIDPCALGMLLFLISILIPTNDRKRMWFIGLTFILSSAVIYFFFMLIWIKITGQVISLGWFKKVIGLIAITASVINFRAFMKEKRKDECLIIEKKVNVFWEKIKSVATKKNLFITIISIFFLSLMVNIFEFTCSIGLPLLFTQILAMHSLSNIEYIAYILLYIFFLLLDDFIILILAINSLKITGVSINYSKYSYLVGGIIMLIIGLLLIIKPSYLLFGI